MAKIDFRGDYHVHSTFSDDAVSTIGENVLAAVEAGLTTVRLVDHVRASTSWVPEFLAAVAATPRPPELVVLTGVEAKLLDASGHLDLPRDLRIGPGVVDRVLIADHQFPALDGPWTPAQTRQRLAHGFRPAHALDLLVMAYVNAMRRLRWAQLAHPLSILPKIGLSEEDLTDEQLATLAGTAAETGTLVEVNEKWACPGPRAIRAFAAAGATLVAASDSHACGDVGRYRALRALASGVEVG